jgi:hypothetical protein
MALCCMDGLCPMWAAKFPDEAEHKQHFHCTKIPCFSRGLLHDEEPFTCAYLSHAKKHVQSHESRETKIVAASKKLWTWLHKSSKSLHREVRTKNQTQFRLDINARNKTKSPVPQGTINWLSRLFIGKVGATAETLLATITQFGTNPGPNSIVTSPRPHITQQHIPLPGYTILFYPDANIRETWFGVCCSDIYEVDVPKGKGPGLPCSILREKPLWDLEGQTGNILRTPRTPGTTAVILHEILGSHACLRYVYPFICVAPRQERTQIISGSLSR